MHVNAAVLTAVAGPPSPPPSPLSVSVGTKLLDYCDALRIRRAIIANTAAAETRDR